MTLHEEAKQLRGEQAAFERHRFELFQRNGAKLAAWKKQCDDPGCGVEGPNADYRFSVVCAVAGLAPEIVHIYIEAHRQFGHMTAEMIAEAPIYPGMSQSAAEHEANLSAHGLFNDVFAASVSYGKHTRNESFRAKYVRIAEMQVEAWWLLAENLADDEALEAFYERGKLTDRVLPQCERDLRVELGKVKKAEKTGRCAQVSCQDKAAIDELERLVASSEHWKISDRVSGPGKLPRKMIFRRGKHLFVKLEAKSAVGEFLEAAKMEIKQGLKEALARWGDRWVDDNRGGVNAPWNSISTIEHLDSLRGVVRDETPEVVDLRNGKATTMPRGP